MSEAKSVETRPLIDRRAITAFAIIGALILALTLFSGTAPIGLADDPAPSLNSSADDDPAELPGTGAEEVIGDFAEDHGDELVGDILDDEKPPDDDEYETPTPDGDETPTPDGDETPTPDGDETPTPDGDETPTPDGDETPTPDGDETPTPDGDETPTPDGDETPTPDGDETPTPDGDGTPTPDGDETPTPEEPEPPTPDEDETPTPDEDDEEEEDDSMFGLFHLLLLALVGLLAAIGLGIYRGGGPKTIALRVATAIHHIRNRLIATLVSIGAGIEGVVEQLVASWRSFISRLTSLSLPTVPNIPGMLVGLITGIVENLRTKRVTMQSMLNDRSTSAESQAVSTGEGQSVDTSPEAVIRRAWKELVSIVRPRNLRARAPAEVADQGRRSGLPADDVRAVLDAFRSLEYADRIPDDDRLARVEQAVINLHEEQPE